MHYSAFVYVLLAGYGMSVQAHWHAMEYVEIREWEVEKVGSFFPQYRSQELNSGHQTWWQMPVPEGPKVYCYFKKNKSKTLVRDFK